MGYRVGTRTMGTKTNASSLDMAKNMAIPEEGRFATSYTASFVLGRPNANKTGRPPSNTMRLNGLMTLNSPQKSPARGQPVADVSFGLIGSNYEDMKTVGGGAGGFRTGMMFKSSSAPQVGFRPNSSSSQGSRTSGRGAVKRAGSEHILGFKPREARRALLECLADPNVETTAQELFNMHDTDNSGSIEPSELLDMLSELHHKLAIQKPDIQSVDALFKRFDLDNNRMLDFREFFDVFIAELRRSAFDRTTLFGREFFVTKNPGRAWDTFERIKELGTGSFGTAYLCRHKRTQEDYVVKAVKKSRAKIPVEDIEKEIMVMRQVDHPHLVRLFEWYEDKGRVYLVLEALKGGTLKDVIMEFQRMRKGLKETWTRSVCRQTMEAINYCHSLRLVHKDIKDENIMLLEKDRNYDKPFVVVIDLGIAEMFSLADPSGQECGGTPTTMAPEVWTGAFGPKCDVFSLGCVLYEMLAGQMPFLARSMQPLQWTRLHKKGPDYGRIISSPLGKDLCQQMLTYEDTARPSMAECLKHPWFEADQRVMKTVPPAQFMALQSFCQEAALKRTLLLEIASRLPMARCAEIIELWEEFDTDRDGTLTPEELRKAFKRLGISDERLVDRIFKSLDVDNDGFLSFSEFAAGVLCVFGDLLEDRLFMLFKEYDENSDGTLDRAEAEEFLKNAALLLKKDPKSRSTKMLQDMLSNGQTGIKYEELRDKLFGPKTALAPQEADVEGTLITATIHRKGTRVQG